MTLDQFIDTIIDIAEELKNEAIDFEKMKVLYNLLNKLVEKYGKRIESVSFEELDGARFKLAFEMEVLKSDKTKQVLDTLYSMTIRKIQGNLLPCSESEDVILNNQVMIKSN